MLALVVRVPGETVRRVSLAEPSLTLGRSSSAGIPLGDRTLSRTHARIDASPAGPVLTDLESRNGTVVNGVRIAEPVLLRAGDTVVLGETTLEVVEEVVGSRVVLDAPERESVGDNTLFRSSLELLNIQRQAPAAAMGAEELSRLAASLRILNEVSMELLRDLPEDKLLDLLLEKLFAYLQPDRALVVLWDEAGAVRTERTRFAEGLDPSDIRLSRTLVRAVREERNGVLMIDSATDERLATSDSIRLQGVTSCLAAPLFVDEEVIGLVYLEARLGRRSFGEDDLRLVTSVANAAAIKVQNLALVARAANQERMEREMKLAWDVQQKLLPQGPPDLPHTALTGQTIPARFVAGDYFDYYERPDGTVDVVVADVAGKGTAASLLAAMVQAAFGAWASEGFPPERICERLNDMVARRTGPEKFVTFFAAHYDPETGNVLYTNAGHNPGLLIRSGGAVELLEAHGTPLGIVPGRRYGSDSLTMAPGDLMVLYSDGVTEATNPDDLEFGLDRLRDTVLPGRFLPLRDLAQSVVEELTAFAAGIPFADDRTLVILRRTR